MVQRYENDYGDMMSDDDGFWVKYEDYVELRKDRDYWYETCLAAGLLDNTEAW